MRKRIKWTDSKVKWLTEHYHNTPNSEIAKKLRLGLSTIQMKAHLLGLKKDPALVSEYAKKISGKRVQRAIGHRDDTGGRICFTCSHASFCAEGLGGYCLKKNKGIMLSGWCPLWREIKDVEYKR